MCVCVCVCVCVTVIASYKCGMYHSVTSSDKDTRTFWYVYDVCIYGVCVCVCVCVCVFHSVTSSDKDRHIRYQRPGPTH
jgi:hypothetical protein